MFEWTEDVMRFRADAAAYLRFDEKIADKIKPHLPASAHVCDAGCGMGQLSLALATLGFRVTAVDSSETAISALERGKCALGPAGQRVKIVKANLFAMRPREKYGAMVFCMFGGAEEILRAAAVQCEGPVVIIKKHWENHRFTLENRPLEKYTFLQTCQRLIELGVPYKTETFPLDMGQPFRSLEDAKLFFGIYGGGGQQREEEVAARLTATCREDFPYYLPAMRELGMIIADSRDIRITEPVCE